MKTIAYYISDYGYGHAARSIAVIRELLNVNKELQIIVCHSFGIQFVKKSILSDRVSFREINTDIGYFLRKGSIFPDAEKLCNEYKDFIAEWQQKIEREEQFLQDNKVDLVISDISPLPFEAASNLGITSVGVSNFTWYTAYQGLVKEAELNIFKRAYQKMSYFFALAGSNEPKWSDFLFDYGLISRNVNLQEVQKIRKFLNPKGQRKIIFIGAGMKIDIPLENLPIWDSENCVFVVSSNVEVNKPNVFHIPTDYTESQNYIAASNLVISKAGWGTIAEAVNSNVPLLILNRPSMNEDQNTICYLKERDLCRTIDWDYFKRLTLEQDFLDKMSGFRGQNQNEARLAAEDLLKLIFE